MTPLDAALDYVGRGFHVVPIIPGDKYPPMLEWQKHATNDADTVRRWWSGPYKGHGVGVAPRQLPDGRYLVIIDVDEKPAEGVSGSETLRDLTDAYGELPATPTVESGSGGRHLYLGAPVEIRNGKTNRLGPGIDVRGVGGQSCAPPTIHPNGLPYLWNLVDDLDVPVADIPGWMLDLLAPKPEPTSTPRSTVWDGFDDSPAGCFNRATTWPELLDPDGWRLDHVREGVDYWTRPGKDDGTSATVGVHGKDILHVFTSSVPYLDAEGNYSRFKYYAARHHGGDTSAAARAILANPDKYPPVDVPNLDAESGSENFRTPIESDLMDNCPQGIDADAEKDSENCRTPIETPTERPTLPETFWTSRPVFEHIRQAARSRRVGPTALLGHVLARVAAYTDPNYCVPPFIGGTVPLSIYVAQVASSGGGKSTPAKLADELVPKPDLGVVSLPLGSGEGLVEAFLENVREKNADGKTVTVKKQVRRGALFTLDEGSALADIGNRSGSTILPTLCSAFAGVELGAAYAKQETFRHLAAGTYAVGVVFLFQPKNARILFADVDRGLPQRFLFVESGDPDRPDIRPEYPGPLPWTPPVALSLRHPLQYPDEAAAETDRQAAADLAGTRTEDPLDSHRNLNRLKVAGLFAVLDDRHTVTVDDWNLAETFLHYSDAVRRNILATIRADERQREETADNRAARRQLTVEGAVERRSRENAVRAVARKVAAADGPVSRRTLARAIAGRDRNLVTIDAVIDEAVLREHIAHTDADEYIKGKKPL